MSARATTSPNSFCVNPATGRPVRIGGTRWRTLVRNNSISPQEKAGNVVYRIPADKFSTDEEAISHLNEEKERIIAEIRAGKHRVPTTTNVVRKGTLNLVYQRKKISIDEIVEKTVRAACHVLDEIRLGALDIERDLDVGSRQNLIFDLIVERMASPSEYNHIPPMMPTVCRAPQGSGQRAFETDTDYSESGTSDEEYGFS